MAYLPPPVLTIEVFDRTPLPYERMHAVNGVWDRTPLAPEGGGERVGAGGARPVPPEGQLWPRGDFDGGP